MSNVLVSNDPKLVGTAINELTVASLVVDPAAIAGQAASDIANNPVVRENLDSLQRFVNDHSLLPFSENEISTLKAVAAGGIVVIGGLAIISAVNKGIG